MVLFISVVVILLSLFILYNNFSQNKNLLYLCASLIFMCISAILHHFTILSPNRFWIAILLGHSIPIAFLTGPFLYFYTRNTLRVSIRFSKLDCLHLVPFIISLISIFPYYFIDFDIKLSNAQLVIDKPANILEINFSWLYPSFVNVIVRPFILFGYSTACLILVCIQMIKKKGLQLNKQQENIAFKWLLIINSIIVLMSLGYGYLTIHFYNLRNTEKSLDIINSSIFAYVLVMLFSLIPMLMIIFPEILYGFHKIKKEKKKSEVIAYKENHAQLVDTSNLILDFVKKEENLLNPDFGIADICKELNLTVQDVQYCFKMILKTKFITLRKELRVDLAKKELIDDKLLTVSMEGVWMNSGFSSKTVFFVAFKDVTGMTPLEYLKSLEKQPTKNL
jgi:AraC-like DNA-binding protein